MNDLTCFLSQNAVAVENVKLVVSKRFLGKDGKPTEWEIRGVTSEEDERLKKECTKRVAVPGKKGVYLPETDYALYVGRLAAACTVYPELDNKELQDSYHVMGADSLLKKMLTPGEYNEYLGKVQEINGYDVSLEELKEEAKN